LYKNGWGFVSGHFFMRIGINNQYRYIKQVVGFSAGAAVAAIFKSMSDLSNNDIELILFYPGQIRHF
jgi:hypothetical protein